MDSSSEQCIQLHFSDSALSGFTREVQSPGILPQLNLLVRTFVRTKLEVLTRRRPAYREHFRRNAGRKDSNNDEVENFKD